MKKTLTILHLSADPSSTVHLRPPDRLDPVNEDGTGLGIDVEVKRLENIKLQVDLGDDCDFKPKGAVQGHELLGYLNRFKPDVLHFSGHGRKSGEIVFLDDDNVPKGIAPELFEAMIDTALDNLKVVVLNTCHSHQQAQRIKDKVSCVVCTDNAVPTKAAIGFSIGFYQAIWARRDLATAFKQGKLVSQSENGYGHEAYQLLTREGIEPAKMVLLRQKPLTLSEVFPFQPILQAGLYARDGKADTFAPTKSEYLDGKVHRPKLADEVDRQLEYRGCALVRGRGAAGKTVLATQTALGPFFRAWTSYYLDLGSINFDNIAEALQTISKLADKEVLLIVDNVHVDESAARSLFNHWCESRTQSKLLLLGRWVEAGADVKGRASPLDDLEINSLTLEIATDDLQGVYRRLAQRHQQVSLPIKSPPPEALEQWLKLFGGDLIAFSAAVVQRLDYLVGGEWTLRKVDAVDYVHDTYLAPEPPLGPLTPVERQSLLTVAALGRMDLEIATPAEAVPRGSLKKFLKHGVVHQSNHGRDKHVRYKLVHPGLGDLLLTADGQVDETRVFQDLARQSPFSGHALVARLVQIGQSDSAVRVLQILAESTKVLAQSLMVNHLGYARASVEQFLNLEFCDEETIQESLIAEETWLLEVALRTPLHFLADFLCYAEGKLPRVFAHLSAELAKPQHLQTLTNMALRTPLGDLARFLRYAEGKLPQVFAHLSAELPKPQHLQTLTDMALRTPLHLLANFLHYAEGEKKLPRVFAHLSAELAQPQPLQTLTDTALRTPLVNLANFLRYAEGEKKLPRVFEHLSAELAQPQPLQTLTDTALRTPLGDLARFLRYAKGKLPRVFEHLSDELPKPGNVQHLVRSAYQCQADSLVSFLRSVPFATKVVDEIDLNTWDKARQSVPTKQPDFVSALDNEFRRFNRPELATAPVLSLIRNSDASDWHAPVIGIVHLSHTLQIGHGADEKEIQRFLDRIATTEWLDSQYRIVAPGAIGASLLSIWSCYSDAIVSRFVTEGLRARITELLNNLATMNVVDAFHTIQLWGASGLLGLDFPTDSLQWLEEWHIHEFLELARPEDETLEPRVIQLWLGLRRMTKYIPEIVSVPHQLGEQFLELWKASVPETDRQESLNQWMIDWLEKCAATDWHLLPDDYVPA